MRYEVHDRKQIVKPDIPASLYFLVTIFLLINIYAEICWANKYELDLNQELTLPSGNFEVLVTSDPYITDFNTYSLACISKANDPRYLGLGLKIVHPKGAETPKLGEYLELIGSSKKRGFGTYDKWLFKKGVLFEIQAKKFNNRGFSSGLKGHIYRLRSSLIQDFQSIKADERARELFEAILLGERSKNKENEKPFRASGLSHLIAVSGSHLSIVAAFVAYLLSSFAGKRLRLLVVVPACIAFHIISGAQDSSLRAIIMLSIVSLAQVGSRRPDPLHALGFGGSLLLIIKPSLALSLGFQLSSAAILGIFIFQPLLKAWTARLFPYLPNAVKSALAMTCIGQLATLPLSLPSFGEISLIAPLANLLAVPLMTIALNLAVLAALLIKIIRPLGILVYYASELCLNLLIWIADSCASVPWSILKIDYFQHFISCAVLLFFLAIYLWWPSPRIESQHLSGDSAIVLRALSLAIFIFVIILTVFPIKIGSIITETLRQKSVREGIYVLDVGQGDSNLIVSDEMNALIDCGPDKESLKSELKSLGVKNVERLYFTHLHSDHYAGAFGLRSFGIKEIVVAQGAAKGEQVQAIARYLKVGIREISDDDIEFVGKFQMEVFGPNTQVQDSKDNEASLILFVDEKSGSSPNYRSALITGDAEARQVLSAFSDEERVPKIDVLKVGHHGSKASLSPSLLKKLMPSFAVISVGANNSYGHPTKQSLNYLKDFKIPVSRTDQLGSIYLGAH